MKELAIISGKGGTGKTSVVAAVAALADSVVCADCDVDAADLHLILSPEIRETHRFEGGLTAAIDRDACAECDECREHCRFGAIDADYRVDALLCEGCGVCHDLCPVGCIRLDREVAGDWFVSDTRFGPLVHARLGIAQENSGKLVAEVRGRARQIAEEQGRDLVLIDGSPGIGCPVISSITGADQVLIVTEPTLSGAHDMDRVLQLARHFGVPAAVCVNKCDLNPDVAEGIESACAEHGAAFVGRIPFDPEVTRAMVAGLSLPEHGSGPAVPAVKTVWDRVAELLKTERKESHAHL